MMLHAGQIFYQILSYLARLISHSNDTQVPLSKGGNAGDASTSAGCKGLVGNGSIEGFHSTWWIPRLVHVKDFQSPTY